MATEATKAPGKSETTKPVAKTEPTKPPVKTAVPAKSSLMLDRIKIAVALACIVAGVWGYYFFSDTALVLRVLMVLGGLVLAGVVAYLSTPGKQFFVFAQESWQEAQRVAWPTRKETIQTTAIVFAFVVIMALFLFSVDSTLAWIVQLLTGRGQG